VAENWIRVQECKVVLRWMQTQERPGSGMQMVADPGRARIRREPEACIVAGSSWVAPWGGSGSGAVAMAPGRVAAPPAACHCQASFAP